MKSVSIRQLHERTGWYVRQVAETGGLYVTDRGRTVARIVPEQERPEVPYFARRRLLPGFRAVMHRLSGGTDSTTLIAQDREDRDDDLP